MDSTTIQALQDDQEEEAATICKQRLLKERLA